MASLLAPGSRLRVASLRAPGSESQWRLSRTGRAAAAGSLLLASVSGSCPSRVRLSWAGVGVFFRRAAAAGSEWREFSRTSSEIDAHIQHRDRPRPVAAVLI